MYTDVGPMRPVDFPWYRHHLREKAQEGGSIVEAAPSTTKVERVLRRVERNLTALIHNIPMVEIEYLSPSMQPHVVGVPRAWVQLFRCLSNVTVCYSRANRPRS
jgi:hypothetical protein